MKKFRLAVKVRGREVTFNCVAADEAEARRLAQKWAAHFDRAADQRGVVSTYMPPVAATR